MNIIEKIKENAMTYGSLPFWSWNDKLEETELRRQIRRMKELGMNGFFMHARGGLETEYLSEDWFNCVNICVDEAKKLGMEAWAYDENGWPSGFAGGKLLKDKKNFAVGLLAENVTEFPTDEETVAVYTKNADGSYNWIKEPVGEACEYLRVFRQYDVSYVDVLDAEITKEFLRLTHEEYKNACGEEFGKTMPGFFTDEPQYFRWGNTYSNTLPHVFYETYGYEVFTGLPALFEKDVPGGEKFRFDYYKLIHEMYINNWVKVVYEWCEENGVQLTGHSIEEFDLNGQMMCCGGIMPFYEYQHIPGIDYLGRYIYLDTAPKQLGSVCAQLGRKKALSEMFACCGWAVSPTELKRIADIQYAAGVNLMCQHLYPYSERGQRKRDYPLHYSDHNPWQESMISFDWHYNFLGAALAEGEEYAPILVVHPIHGVYMNYKKNEDWHFEMDQHFKELSLLLAENQIPYHFGDENMMKRMASVDGEKIKVGLCTYDTVIIPFTPSLDAETAEMLKTFLANGGKLWIYKGMPSCINGVQADMSWLRANITFDDILAKRDVRVSISGKNAPAIRKMTRKLQDGSSLIYLTNVTDKEFECIKVGIPEAKNVAEIDLASLELKPVHGEICEKCGGRIAYLRFEDAQSHLLLVNGAEIELMPGKPTIPEKYIPVPETAAFAKQPENMMTLDNVSLSKDGIHYEEPLVIYGVKDNLLREQYNGRIWLKYTFHCAEDYKTDKLNLILEPMGQDSVTVNGYEVQPIKENWWFDRSFAGVNIADLIRPGENEVIVSLHHYQRDYVYYVLYGGVSESLRNCLVFDTEIEAAYLTGDFALPADGEYGHDVLKSRTYSGRFVLSNQKDTVYLKDIVEDGYPFYGGNITVRYNYDYALGSPTELALQGSFATVSVKVNGVCAGEMMFLRHLDLSDYLQEGTNEIELTITNAMRNLLGPHHRHEAEPFGVDPYIFSYEKEWNGRECADHLERYAFVSFGVESK